MKEVDSSNEALLVAILVAQSIEAGASIEQLARATKRPQREIRQMLAAVERLERLVARELATDAIRTEPARKRRAGCNANKNSPQANSLNGEF